MLLPCPLLRKGLLLLPLHIFLELIVLAYCADTRTSVPQFDNKCSDRISSMTGSQPSHSHVSLPPRMIAVAALMLVSLLPLLQTNQQQVVQASTLEIYIMFTNKNSA